MFEDELSGRRAAADVASRRRPSGSSASCLQRGQRECVPASLKARPPTTWLRSPGHHVGGVLQGGLVARGPKFRAGVSVSRSSGETLFLWLQTPFDQVYQTTPDVLRLCVIEAAQGTVDQEHCQAVYRRPGQELGAQTPLGGQDAHLDEPAEEI